MAARRQAEAAGGRRTAPMNMTGGHAYDRDVIAAPRAYRALLAALALGAMPAAASADGLSLGLERLPGPDDRAPVRALARRRQLRARPGRHVRGLDGRLEADRWREGRRPAASRSRFTEPVRSNALSLPSGSSATTPPMCVAVLDPTMRYFAANDGGLLSLLRVEIIYHPPGGGDDHAAARHQRAGGKAWAPSLPGRRRGRTCSACSTAGRPPVAVPLLAGRARREVADRRRLRRSPRQPLVRLR